MNPAKTPILQTVLAHVPLRGVPTLLRHLAGRRRHRGPQPCRVAAGFTLDLDLRDPDQWAMQAGLYGTAVLELAATVLRPGDTVIDVGAQVGYLSAAFAQRVGPGGQVHAFEPDPTVLPGLQRSVAANPELRITVHPFALAEREGDATLHVSPTKGWSTLRDAGYPEIESVSVATRTLDSLVAAREIDASRLRLVKIDVEGSEPQVLRGMADTLRNHRPFLICELNVACLRDSGQDPDELLAQLRGHGYRTRAILPPVGWLRTRRPRLADVAATAELASSVVDLWCTPRGLER